MKGWCALAPAAVMMASVPAWADDMAVAQRLVQEVCLPVAAAGNADRVVLPNGWNRLNNSAARPYLGGEAGDAFVGENSNSSVLALWEDGRCAVYLRMQPDAPGMTTKIESWLADQGLQTDPAATQTSKTPAGADLVVRNMTGTAGTRPVLVTLSHHTKDGSQGGVTVSVVPGATRS